MGTLAPKGDLSSHGGAWKPPALPAKAALATACRAHPREATQQEAFKFRTSRAAVTPSRQFQDAS